MKGNLTQRPPFDVLSEVQRRQASGILRLQRGEGVRQIFLDAGVMIRFAASNLPGESMTSLFKEKGGVGDDQLRKATAAKQPQELLGTTLVRLGMMTPLDLAQITADHIRRVLHNALAMHEGQFEFQPGALPFREQLDGGLGTAEVLLMWARENPDLQTINRYLGSTSARVQMARRPPEGYQQVPLNPAEGYIMSRVDGTATVNEICIVSPMGEETTLRALFGLALAGMIDIPRPGSSPATPAPQPAAGPAKPAAATATAAVSAPRPAPAPSAAPASRQAPPAAPAQRQAPPAAAAPTQPQSPAAGAPAQAAPGTGASPAAASQASSGSPAAVAPARVPKNGGAPKPGPAGARPGAGRPAPTAPRKVQKVVERVRPSTSAELESEMLQRFSQMRDQDLYQVLGVLGTASTSDVRRAYYGLAKRFHPDKFTREELKAKAEQVFAHITEAYSTLSKDETRQKYDEDLASRRPKSHDKPADTHDLARQNFRHGKDQFDKGKFGEALSFFQNACEQDGSKAEYFFYLAMTQSKNPRWKKDAETNFLKALDIDPANAELYANLGALYAKGGLHSKARDMFRKALQWDPANAMAQEGLATEEESGKKGLMGMFKK